MGSRYDFMESSSVKDPITEAYYPDPLSLNYLNYFYKIQNSGESMNSRVVVLDDNHIKNFYKTISRLYGSPIYDDLVLTLNKCPHKNFLKNGDKIIVPDLNIMISSFKKNKDL